MNGEGPALHPWLTTTAEAAAVGHCQRLSSAIAAPPTRRRAAMHCWWPSLRSWWRQLALLLAIGPAILAVEDYGDVHGVVNATDLSMFRKVGMGECLAPASRPVRGRARQDLDHLACRQKCIVECLGYTYAPCERVCTIHGNPELLSTTPDTDGWATVNGGGKIDGSAQRCGSTCYQRMAPCVPGRVVSNTALVDTDTMAFGSTSVKLCPLPYTGTLEARCGLFGPYVVAGRCRSPCNSGVVLSGNFDVHYAEFLHGQRQDAPCPSGATGTISVECNDGKVTWVSGRCGYDCVLGSLVEGDAVLSYGKMPHTSFLDMDCPDGTSGNVTIQCWDSTVSTVRGTCNYNCDPGDLLLSVGQTTDSVGFGAFNHSDNNETDCGSDWFPYPPLHENHTNFTINPALTRPLVVLEDNVPIFEEFDSDLIVGRLNKGDIVMTRDHAKMSEGDVLFEGDLLIPIKRHGARQQGAVNSGWLMEAEFEGDLGLTEWLFNASNSIKPVIGEAFAVYPSMRMLENYVDAAGLPVPVSVDITKIQASNYKGQAPDLSAPPVLNPVTGIPLSHGASSTACKFRLKDGTPSVPCFTMNGLGKCQALSDMRKYNLRLAEVAVCQWFFNKPCLDKDANGCEVEVFAPLRFSSDLSVFLPKYVNGKRFLVKQDASGKKWRASNSELNSLEPGIKYRKTKNDGDYLVHGGTNNHFLAWGEVVTGVETFDGWVRFEAPVVGMLVQVITDAKAYELECKVSGLSWPTFPDPELPDPRPRTIKLGTYARIVAVDLQNETVMLSEGTDWGIGENKATWKDFVPIRALVGLQSFGQENYIGGGLALAAHSVLCEQRQLALGNWWLTDRCALGGSRRQGIIASGLQHSGVPGSAVTFRPTHDLWINVMQNVTNKIGFNEIIFAKGNQPPEDGGLYAVVKDWTGLSVPKYCDGLSCLVEMLQNSPNFTGKINLQCYRGKVSVAGGRCYRHCLPGAFGLGVKATPYRRFDHDTKMTVQCTPGFIGEMELECYDGNVTLVKGQCMMHCLAGSVTSNSLKLPHASLVHLASRNITCPWPESYGSVNVTCTDGAVSFVGVCGANCMEGSYWDRGATVPWTFIRHGITENLTCPAPWVGHVQIRCYDGSSRYTSGWCGRQCSAGAVNKNGAIVYYTKMNHSQVKHYECQSLFATGLSFSGGVTIICNDGGTRSLGYCEADCPDGKLSKDGSQVFYPRMEHLGTTDAICTPGTPNFPLYGTVRVECQRGFAKVLSGTCGAPCDAGEFRGSQTRDEPVVHPQIAHMDSKMVICPSHLSGYVKLFCTNSFVAVVGNGTCGDRCPQQYFGLYGASLTTPLMEHKAALKWPCDPPFNGDVLLACDSGALNVTSQCKAQCKPGNMTMVTYGAVIHYPQMMHGELYATQCPPGYVDVPVVIRCADGHGVLESGGCFKHCSADWFYDPAEAEGISWSVQHYEIYHDGFVLIDCPQYFDGLITLGCWSGKVTMNDGGCTKNCKPTRFQVRPGVIVRNREMTTGQMANTIPCPPSFDGNMRLLCTEGVISLGEGGCNSTCSPGVLLTAPYGELGDGEVAAVACPDSGTLTLLCTDGKVTVLGGRCLLGCKEGTVIDANGTRIEHPYIRHNESTSGACSGLATGVVNLLCNDSTVQMEPQPGEQCLRSCVSQAVNTPDGSVVFPANTVHGNQQSERCPNALLGIVTLACYDTEFTVIDGVCGDTNCPESNVFSNGAALPHFEINNGWKAGPTTCPGQYEGIATFECRNGTTVVDEVTVQLPVSPRDWEAVAIGNKSSDDSRFVLCGCCLPRSIPPPAPDVKGLETGIFLYVVGIAAGVSIMVAAFSGWYFLPRKKTSRVWPEKIKPSDPRPIMDKAFEQILDKFQLELRNNPQFMKTVLSKNVKIQALPPYEQKMAIENIKTNSGEAKKYFTRRSVQYLLACEDKIRSPSCTSPSSPSSRHSNNNVWGKPSPKQPPQLAAIGDVQDETMSEVNVVGTPVPAWQDVPMVTDGQELDEVAVIRDDLRELADAPQKETSPKAIETSPS